MGRRDGRRPLAALADPTRRRVVELLREGPQRASDLARAVDMSPPAMSRHLKTLLQQGLVADARDPEDARVRLFRLRPDRFDELDDWLEHIRAFWTEQLANLKRHVEREDRSA